MSLAKMMLPNIKAQSNRIEKISVKFIRRSEYNRMPIKNINELAIQIQTNGLQNPIHVRAISDTEFVVVGGERRLTATKALGYTEIETIIREDIQSDRDEKLAVAINNVQREETKEILQMKIFEWADIYEEEKKLGNIEKGLRRVDWIAQFTNCSRSTVQRYLKSYGKIDGNTIKEKNKNVKTADIKFLENKLSSFSGSKVILSNKSLTFKYTDTEDLNRIFETIGFDLNKQ